MSLAESTAAKLQNAAGIGLGTRIRPAVLTLGARIVVPSNRFEIRSLVATTEGQAKTHQHL